MGLTLTWPLPSRERNKEVKNFSHQGRGTKSVVHPHLASPVKGEGSLRKGDSLFSAGLCRGGRGIDKSDLSLVKKRQCVTNHMNAYTILL